MKTPYLDKLSKRKEILSELDNNIRALHIMPKEPNIVNSIVLLEELAMNEGINTVRLNYSVKKKKSNSNLP